jgi:hypothetical protein
MHSVFYYYSNDTTTTTRELSYLCRAFIATDDFILYLFSFLFAPRPPPIRHATVSIKSTCYRKANGDEVAHDWSFLKVSSQMMIGFVVAIFDHFSTQSWLLFSE